MLPFHCPILPDEHVFSWINRIHLLFGYPKLAQTLSHIGIGNYYFKPFTYNQALQGAINFYMREYGDSQNAFDNHTPLLIWSLSVAPEYFSTWRENNRAIVSTGHLGTKALTQVMWKYCPQCLIKDIDETGHSYWHVRHQFPGLTHCTDHKTSLVEDFEQAKDLRRANFPQIENYRTISSDDNEDLLQWSSFINEVYESISLNSQVGFGLQYKVRHLLQIPEKIKQKERDLPIFDALKRQFDNDIPKSILRYLFSSEDKYRLSKVNIFKQTMGYQGGLTQSKIAHPVYWLAILFWIKNDISLGI